MTTVHLGQAACAPEHGSHCANSTASLSGDAPYWMTTYLTPSSVSSVIRDLFVADSWRDVVVFYDAAHGEQRRELLTSFIKAS